MVKTLLIPTSAVEYLARRIKNKLGNFEVIFPGLNKDGKRYFPDGEVYMRILKADKLRSRKVVVLHSGAPRPNEGLAELELILEILKDYKIKPEIFFTYFPYGMQDKIFEKGETNVAKNLIKKLINYYKVKKIYIIDPHFGGRKWIKKYPIASVSAVPYLIKKAKQDFKENILFLSPDKGGIRRTGFSGIKKERLTSFKVEIISPKLNLKGKTVGVVDDLLETGGTLLRFYEFAKNSGAKKVITLITHGVLPAGVSKIKRKYSKLYLTNTINQKDYNPPTASSRRKRAPANIDITNLILETLS